MKTMSTALLALVLTLSATAFADRADDCAHLGKEIRYTESLVSVAKKQGNMDALVYLLQVLSAQKAAFKENCTLDI